MSIIDLFLWAVILLPALLTLLSSRAPFFHRIGWALLALVPFPLAFLVAAWRAAGGDGESLADVGYMAFMFLGGWFIYFKFRSKYQNDA